MGISLCMIVKDEEKSIEKCLASMDEIVDEIIIVDTGSTDSTKDICRKFKKARVFDFKWSDDFSAARNESLKHATEEWILVLDADETIPQEDLEKIRELTQQSDVPAFSLEQRSYLHDNSYVSHWLVRFFRNTMGFYFKNRVHELVEDSVKEKGLEYKKEDIVIKHSGSLKDAKLINEKKEYYKKLLLKQLEENPGNERYNYQVGRMYVEEKEFDKALEFLEKASKINPNYKLVFSDIAKVHLQLRNNEKAIEFYKKSLELNPGNPSPANNLAVVLMSVGKFEEAKEILKDQIKKHPQEKALRKNYDQCLKNLNAIS